MRRICGFALFWIAVGITISLFIKSTFFTVCLIFVLLILGYNLFCC